MYQLPPPENNGQISDDVSSMDGTSFNTIDEGCESSITDTMLESINEYGTSSRSAQVNPLLQPLCGTRIPSPQIQSRLPSIGSISGTLATPVRPSNRARKLRSWTWGHFKKVYSDEAISSGRAVPTTDDHFIAVCQERDNLGRRCNFKKDSRKLTGGTTGVLISHLISSHSFTRDGQKVVPSDTSATFLGPLSPEKKVDPMDNLVECFADADLPFILSENKYFKLLLKNYLKNPCNILRSGSLAARTLSKYQDILFKIKNKLEKSCKTIAFTLDMWTSPNGYGILAINGTWLDENFKFNRELLYFNKISGEHNEANLANITFQVLKDFNLCEKLFSISAGNATNNSALCKHLDNSLSAWASTNNATVKFSIKNRVSCMSHVINLICQDMIKVMNDRVPILSESAELAQPIVSIDLTQSTQPIIENSQSSSTLDSPKERGYIQTIRDLVLRINQNSHRRDHWLTFSPICLNSDIVTRWNSTYKMLSNALELRDCLCEFVKARPELQSYTLDDAFWNRIKRITDILRVFELITERLSQEETSLHLGLFYYNLLDTSLSFIREHEPVGTIFHQAALAGQKVLDKYVRLAKENDIYYIASILNPAQKMKYIQYNKEEGDMIVGKIQQVLRSAYPAVLSPVPIEDPKDVSEQFKQHTLICFREDSGFRMSPTCTMDLSDDMEQYFKNPAFVIEGFRGTEAEMRNWWDGCKNLYPRMALVARDYLCIPISEIDIERLFSWGRDSIEIRRQTLSPEVLNALMMIKAYNRRHASISDE